MRYVESLQALGLTENEIKVYGYLLRVGEASGRAIVLSSNLDKSSVYRSIAELEHKGLIYRIGERRNQKFVPYSHDKLLNLQRQKEEEIQNNRRELEAFINDLQTYAKKQYKSSNVLIFEGAEGYVAWNDARLYKKGSLIRELTTRRAIEPYVKDYYRYMDDYISKRIKKGISMRVLFDTSEENDRIDITSKKLFKESRQIESKLKLDAIMSTFGTKCGFYSGEDKNAMGIIINDSLIANLINSMFDYMWERAKPVY